MGIITRKALKNIAMEKSLTTFSSNKKNQEKVKDSLSIKDYDIFLSHSFLDAVEIDALSEDIKEMGFSVYIDWKENPELDRRKVTAKTAEYLRKKMDACSCLLYVVTSNTSKSKWCPWELGYFDGKKGRSAILPILDIKYDTNKYYGTEYLGIYPYITKNLISNDNFTLFVHKNENSYISFKDWLNGEKIL